MCYVHGARRRAEAADVVVTNHSLLFCDLMADGGLLPPIRYWVVDEAHGTEDEARKAFSIALSAEDILRISRGLASDEASRNAFVRAERERPRFGRNASVRADIEGAQCRQGIRRGCRRVLREHEGTAVLR